MRDLIDRQKLRENVMEFFPEASNVIELVIDREPAVDAVPVIHCRDCRYAEASEHPGCIVCTAWGCRSELDGYCHQAERK